MGLGDAERRLFGLAGKAAGQFANGNQRFVTSAARQIHVALGSLYANLRFGLQAQRTQRQQMVGQLIGLAQNLLGGLFGAAPFGDPRSDRQWHFLFG